VRKLLRFPWTNPGEPRVYLGLLDIVLTYKTVERFDETLAEEVAVLGYELWLDNVRSGAEFRGLAQHSFQSIGGKQLILAMFQIKDIVDCVVCAAKLQLLQRHSQDSSLDQCFHWEGKPVLFCYPAGIQYSSPRS
jgi:hypothetical protein